MILDLMVLAASVAVLVIVFCGVLGSVISESNDDND